jgi:thiol:disulfide interchange protein DsbC
MKFTSSLMLSLLLSFGALNVSADSSDVAHKALDDAGAKKEVVDAVAKNADELKAMLVAKYPNTKFGAVTPMPINGIYQVITGKNVTYSDATGRYFMFGSIYDMQERKDLTGDVRKSLSAIDWNTLPLKDAIKVVKGDGSREFAVFSDPDCPYCKRLEGELDKLNNFTAYIFPFPIPGLHAGSDVKAKQIWCSKEQAKVWHDTLLSGKSPIKVADCTNPIDDNISLANKLHINGTPTLISKDGRTMPGYAPADKLDKWLSAK